MTPEQFCYWLQGFMELNDGAQPTPKQIKAIQDHLQTVFKKVTPSYTTISTGVTSTPSQGVTISRGLFDDLQQTPPTRPSTVIC